jgi:hypothetical protein
LITTEAVAVASPSPVHSQAQHQAETHQEDDELQRREHALHDGPFRGVPSATFLGV